MKSPALGGLVLSLLLSTTPLLAGCSALGNQHAIGVPGSRARVSSEDAPELAAMIEEVEPRVVALLGTSWPLPYEVRIAEPSGDWNAETRTSDRRVTIRPGQLEAWRLAHELVHVHASGRWDGLPGVVEEGLAYLVGELAVGRKPEIVPPSPEALRLALTMSYGRWLTLDDERHHAVKNAAMWLALQLLPAAEVAFEPRELGDAGLRELHRATR